MRLTETAIKAINNPRVRSLITLELECSEMSTKRYITANEENGPLTTVGALTVIRAETKMDDTEILESKVTME